MQPVWDEYVAATRAGSCAFNTIDYTPPPEPQHAANALLDRIDTIPVVLAVAADLRRIVATDAELDRAAIVPGASIYPFCWNLLLAARQRGLGGVMTTFLSRVEPSRGTPARVATTPRAGGDDVLGVPGASTDPAQPT